MIKSEEALSYYWDGLLRSYARLSKIETGKWYEKDFASELDLYYCFFIRCYHFKDWLVTTVAQDAKDVVEQFVDHSSELSLCRDICNATKHFSLDDARRKRSRRLRSVLGPDGIALFREYDPSCKRRYRIRIEAADKRWNAQDLATACMEQWLEFVDRRWNLRLHGLI
jgi:hypothetical protein